MGSPLSGTMAEVFLQQLENLHIKPLLDSKCIVQVCNDHCVAGCI